MIMSETCMVGMAMRDYGALAGCPGVDIGINLLYI